MTTTAHVAGDQFLTIKLIVNAATRLTLLAIAFLRSVKIQRGQQIHGFMRLILCGGAVATGGILRSIRLSRCGVGLLLGFGLGSLLALAFHRFRGLRSAGLRSFYSDTGRRFAAGTSGLKRSKQLRLAHSGSAAQSHLLGKLLQLRQFHALKILAIGHVIYLSTAFANRIP